MRLAGQPSAASEKPRVPVEPLLADWPPLSGALVSMVSWTDCVWFAPTLTFFEEKWQFTAAGSERHPMPMVSMKPLFEVTLTFTVAFCEETRAMDAGFTAIPKPIGALENDTAEEVEGLCSRSTPYLPPTDS